MIYAVKPLACQLPWQRVFNAIIYHSVANKAEYCMKKEILLGVWQE